MKGVFGPAGVTVFCVEIVIVWQEVDAAHAARPAREQKRAELEALAGALADDPIVRLEQPPLDARLPVE